MSATLLATKWFLPPVGKSLVVRPRLLEKLTGGLLPGCRLTLVSAPAGFGKTTLISTWAASHKFSGGRPSPLVAWLSLDEGDNDPILFWSYVITSLQMQKEGLGKQALNLLQASRPPDLEGSLATLVNDLAEIPHPFLLILDDFHHAHDPAIHRSLTYLIEHAPPSFHAMVLSRTDPPLPLALLRGRGQLLEIRMADLRFTPDETAFFLNQIMQLGLSRVDIDALSQRTEGWIAGLQMAALSMHEESDRHTFVTIFSGGDRYIADYLVEEVLQRQPVEHQRFLLQTSILNHLNAPLCDAVTGRLDSQMMLNALERANLFILPLDNRREWFRYHQLFAELLQRRLLQSEGEQTLKTLQRRAVDWLAANGFLKLAAEYALRYADFELAASLIISASDLFYQENDCNTLLNMADRLPKEAIRKNLTLACILAHAANVTGQVHKAEKLIQDTEKELGVTIDEFLRRGEDLELPPLAKASLIEMGMISARLQVDTFHLDRTFSLAEHLLPYLTPERDNEPYVYNPPSKLRGPLMFTLGLAQKLHGDVLLAAQTFGESAAEGQRAHNLHIEALSLGHLGDAQAQQGRLHEAQRTFLQTLDLPQEILRGTPFIGISHAGLGNLAYEWNDLDMATQHLQIAIDQGKWWRNWENLLPGYSGMARIYASRGEWQAAYGAVDDLLANTPESKGIVQSCAGSLRGLLDLRSGNLDAAERWAEAYEPERPCDYLVEWEAASLVGCRIWISRGQAERTGRLLGRILNEASSAGRDWRVLEALCLQAILFDGTQREPEALSVIRSALEMAKQEGYIRTFIDEGQPMAKILDAAVQGGIHPEYAGRLLAAFPGTPLRPPAAWDVPKSKPAVNEVLSERENEVLRLVAGGLTNKEIAQKLHISLRTVKYHTTSIYTRLGVNGRAQAAVRARELGLV